MKSNMEKLAETLNARMQKVVKAREDVTAELGTITSNLGLKVSSVGNTIPKGDYLIARHLTYGEKDAKLTVTKNENAHTHDVLIPESMRSPKAGDRVLVIWCGYEPVVADILVES